MPHDGSLRVHSFGENSSKLKKASKRDEQKEASRLASKAIPEDDDDAVERELNAIRDIGKETEMEPFDQLQQELNVNTDLNTLQKRSPGRITDLENIDEMINQITKPLVPERR
jgi:hypothetical protein